LVSLNAVSIQMVDIVARGALLDGIQ